MNVDAEAARKRRKNDCIKARLALESVDQRLPVFRCTRISRCVAIYGARRKSEEVCDHPFQQRLQLSELAEDDHLLVARGIGGQNSAVISEDMVNGKEAKANGVQVIRNAKHNDWIQPG